MPRIRIHHRLLFAVAFLLRFCLRDAATAGESPTSLTGREKLVRPFFAEHCDKCHGEKKQKGDLRVDTLAIDFDSPKAMGNWEEIMNRINSGDMPPEDEKRPKPDDIARVADWIA
ncbi:MAG: c-type cytochrome domain-containing protein, partial [Chthoniobacteraceae bacterium]